MKRIVVLASGTGTTFQAIVDAVRHGELAVDIAMLITDRPGVPVVARAAAAGIPATVVDRSEYGTALSDRILTTIPADTDLIVLAGFLSILRGAIIAEYSDRIINLHPALLPRFGGPGMYGIHVHRAVIEAGETESGCTVHFVDSGTDTGPILLQRRVPVFSEDTPETLAARIAPVERDALVEGIRQALAITS